MPLVVLPVHREERGVNMLDSSWLASELCTRRPVLLYACVPVGPHNVLYVLLAVSVCVQAYMYYPYQKMHSEQSRTSPWTPFLSYLVHFTERTITKFPYNFPVRVRILVHFDVRILPSLLRGPAKEALEKGSHDSGPTCVNTREGNYMAARPQGFEPAPTENGDVSSQRTQMPHRSNFPTTAQLHCAIKCC